MKYRSTQQTFEMEEVRVQDIENLARDDLDDSEQVLKVYPCTQELKAASFKSAMTHLGEGSNCCSIFCCEEDFDGFESPAIVTNIGIHSIVTGLMGYYEHKLIKWEEVDLKTVLPTATEFSKPSAEPPYKSCLLYTEDPEAEVEYLASEKQKYITV